MRFFVQPSAAYRWKRPISGRKLQKNKRETEILAAELGKPGKGEDAGGNGVKKELGGKGKK